MEPETIIRVLKNVNILLENRGHNVDNINKRLPKNHIIDKIERFKKDNTSLDIFINSTRKVYVKFLSEISDKKDSAIKDLDKIYNILSDIYRLNNDDEFIFVILNDINKDILSIENMHSNLTLFSYKKLLINIVDNVYVPKHTVLDKTERQELKNKLSINHYNDLPILLKSDPVSRYYNFREGDVIRIERPTKGNKIHIAYRYVISDSF
jgi:DNA-directed RNA polymerase subunit H (RpoH/RPB5)